MSTVAAIVNEWFQTLATPKLQQADRSQLIVDLERRSVRRPADDRCDRRQPRSTRPHDLDPALAGLESRTLRSVRGKPNRRRQARQSELRLSCYTPSSVRTRLSILMVLWCTSSWRFGSLVA